VLRCWAYERRKGVALCTPEGPRNCKGLSASSDWLSAHWSEGYVIVCCHFNLCGTSSRRSFQRHYLLLMLSRLIRNWNRSSIFKLYINRLVRKKLNLEFLNAIATKSCLVVVELSSSLYKWCPVDCFTLLSLPGKRNNGRGGAHRWHTGHCARVPWHKGLMVSTHDPQGRKQLIIRQ